MQIVLVAPQIAPNTGNIIRLAANVGASLHLVEPLGFSMDHRLLKRGGLDYYELTDVHVHPDLDAARHACPGRWLALTSQASRRYDLVDYRPDDVLVFGCEATGLPDDVLATFGSDERVRIPMRPDNRSLNLGNAVAVVAYEAWRHLEFDGAAEPPHAPGASTVESLGSNL